MIYSRIVSATITLMTLIFKNLKNTIKSGVIVSDAESYNGEDVNDLKVFMFWFHVIDIAVKHLNLEMDWTLLGCDLCRICESNL